MSSSQQAGSAYHVSALRYAEAVRPLYVGVENEREERHRPRLDQLFEKAEDNYRPGQSSSSSLLIRSNVASTAHTEPSINEDYHDEVAREGFQRTKARALLAQTTLIRNVDGEDQFVGLHGFDHAGSIYLRNRRARNPQSRQSYEQARIRKRNSREKG